MALLPLNLDYTDKDHTSLRTRLFNLIGGVFPTWTDREVANFGNILVELFCHVGDTLLFYQDNQARESRWSDATLRRSILAIAKMLNYTPEGNAAATANVLVTLSEVPTASVDIPAGSIFETQATNNRQSFQVLFDGVILAGQDPPQVYVQVENSSSEDETFTSSGLPSQNFVLRGTPFLDGSEAINAANGGYTRVESFLNSDANDRHYVVDVTSQGRARIRFPNGINGEIPSGTIEVAYKLGGGASGNVGANTITRLLGQLTDVNGQRVVATFSNPESASGGANRETLASIKQKGPASTKVTDRTVSKDDYEIRAINVSGVARAVMVTSNEVLGVSENTGFLYIVPDGGGPSTDTLKATVLETVTVTYPNTITFKVSVVDPQYVPVDVGATVFFPSGFNDAAKRSTVTLINEQLSAYFSVTNDDGTQNNLIDFGINYGSDMALPMSDVFCVVEGVTGVRKIGAGNSSFTLNGAHDDLQLNFSEFPTLGTVIIIDGDTGNVVSPN